MLGVAVFPRKPLLAALLGAVLLGGCASDTDQSAPTEPAASEKQPRRPAPVQDSGTQLVEVPDVTGMDGQDAVDAIEAEGLTASYDQDDPAGCTVEDQDETGRVEPDTEVILTLDCRQRDWENREGDDWDSFTASFAVGAGEGCDALFSLSPDGSLYDGDTEYTVTDCSLATSDDPESAQVEIPPDVPDDPEALGRSLGVDHGCHALFGAELIDVLSYGTDSFTADDCLTAGG